MTLNYPMSPFDDLADIFREQAQGLIEGGVDLLLIETSQDILEVKAAIRGIHQAFEETGIWLPIQAQVTLDTTGRMLLGTDISRGADHPGRHGHRCNRAELLDRSRLHARTHSLSGRTVHPACVLHSQCRAAAQCRWAGSLSAGTGSHLPTRWPNMLKNSISTSSAAAAAPPLNTCSAGPAGAWAPARSPAKHSSPPRLASATQAINMQQEPAPFLIGERLNTQGSAKFKKLVLAEDFESILQVAGQQVDSGAHGLDLCVALTERADEAFLMQQAIKTLAPSRPRRRW